MSQWDSTALANNCCNKSLVRPSFDLAPYYLSGQTQRQDSAKANVQELPNRTYRTSPSGPTALTVSFIHCRIKKSSGIATANPDSATPTTLYPKLSKRCKSMGSHSCRLCMTKCLRGRMKYRFLGAQSLDSMTSLKGDYAISGHAPDASLLALHNRNEKLRGLLRDGICIRSGRQLFRTYTRYSGKMLIALVPRFLEKHPLVSSRCVHFSTIADNPDFRVCESWMFTTHKASGIVAPQRRSIAPLEATTRPARAFMKIGKAGCDFRTLCKCSAQKPRVPSNFQPLPSHSRCM